MKIKRAPLYAAVALVTFGIGVALPDIRSAARNITHNCGSQVSQPPKSPDERLIEENAVYAALINSRSHRVERGPWLIQTQTIRTTRHKDFSEGFFFEYLAPEGLSRETFDDYRQIDSEERWLDSGLDLPYPTIFLDESESRRFFETEGGRSAFGRAYPHADGITHWSRVGFNKQMDQALVYSWLYCGGLCGHGGYVLLKKTPTGWKIVDSNIWIS